MTTPISPKDFSIALLLMGLLLVIIALLNMGPDSSMESSNNNPKEKVKALDLVNKHLREVYDRQEVDRINAENINYLTAPPIGKTPRIEPSFSFDEIPLTFEPDALDQLVGQDLRIIATKQTRQKSLNQKIQQEIIDDIKRSLEEDLYKKALAQALVKKARVQGYAIEVDENLKVRKVRKIEKIPSEILLDENGVPVQSH